MGDPFDFLDETLANVCYHIGSFSNSVLRTRNTLWERNNQSFPSRKPVWGKQCCKKPRIDSI